MLVHFISVTSLLVYCFSLLSSLLFQSTPKNWQYISPETQPWRSLTIWYFQRRRTLTPNTGEEQLLPRTKKNTNTVSMEKETNYPFTLFEKKTQKKRSLGSKFENKPPTVVSGTKHTVTTDEKKVIHRKLISNPLPFQSTVTPTMRFDTRMTILVEKPSCSTTGE